MTGLQYARFVRSQTKTNSTTYPDARFIEDMNIIKDEIVGLVTQINEDYFGMLAYRDLVEGQREYSMPEFMLNNIKYFEIDLVGDSATQPDPTLVTALKHQHANEFDLTRYERSTDESEIRRRFQNLEPCYDIFRNSLWVYSGKPVISVIKGLKLWYMRYPDDIPVARLSNNLADLSNDLILPLSAGIPRQLHKVWAIKQSILFKNSKEKPIPLNQNEKNVEAEIQNILANMSGLDLDRNQKATVPLNTGEDY